jgi:hypothetical protein
MGDNAVKKIIKIIVPLILMLVCVTGAFAQGTLSEEILNQAKREAGLFLELKSALGLDWLDEYNAYLENPTDNPEPSWDLSVADLVSGGYLSDSFPSDFMITKSGQEVKISRIITSQAMKDVLPIYLPSVTIAGDVVSLIVQRPEQWVAWEAGLLGKVSRDGSDNPDILPNAVLDFGKGSEIRFINDDGKLTGIESLIYKAQELDDRFVNTSGDDEMSGTLTADGLKVGAYVVWHEGNDGHREDGSGLDADLLDGEHGSYYLAAENLTGIVPPERLKGTYDIDILGNAATATYASNSDKLDDYDSDHFATADHDHDGKYLIKTKPEGDTMMGKLTASQFQGNIYIPDTRNDTINPGDLFQESRIDFKFANILEIPLPKGYYYTTITMRPWKDDTGGPAHQIALGDGDDIRYRTGTQGSGWSSWNKIWHSGNDGSGSGLDADLLDGKDSSFFTNAGNLSSGIVPVARLSGTYDINISGNAATATKLATARTISLTGDASGSASFDGSSNISINTNVSYSSNSDKLDGYHAGEFVKKSGDTMTGNLTLQGTSINIQRPETPGGYARGIMFYSKDGSTVEAGIGMLGSGNNPPQTLYMGFGISPWSSSAGLTVTPTNITFKNNKVWHAGNDGSGSGLDADLLDGKHASDFTSKAETSAVQTWVSQGTGWRLVTEKYFNGLVRITIWRNATVEGNRYNTRTFTLPITITKYVGMTIQATKQFTSTVFWATNKAASTSRDFTYQTYRVVVNDTNIVTYPSNASDAIPEELFAEVIAFTTP